MLPLMSMRSCSNGMMLIARINDTSAIAQYFVQLETALPSCSKCSQQLGDLICKELYAHL